MKGSTNTSIGTQTPRGFLLVEPCFGTFFHLYRHGLFALALFLSVWGHAQGSGQTSTDLALNNANALLNKTTRQVLFMENRGQVLDQQGRARPDVLFLAKSGGAKMALRANGISYQFEKTNYKEAGKREKETSLRGPAADRPEIESVETNRLDMYLEGANPVPEVVREVGSDYVENYYNIPSVPEGITGVRSWTRIRLKEVYPGIDWLIYSQEGGIKYDFIVRPGADPAQIRMRYAGGAELRLDRSGALTVKTRLGEVREQAPVSYQDGREIPSRFVLEGNLLKLTFTSYDPAHTLIVDPLIWATYYGGTNDDYGLTTAVDGNGNVYLAGETQSPMGIASGGHQETYGGGHDAFLVKFDASGARQWATYYGGDVDYGNSTAVDGSGNVYLAGSTNSTSGIASGGHQNTYGGAYDAFLVKFNASGTRQWATYYGGTGTDAGNSTAVDGSGNVYLAGYTISNTGIASGGHQNTTGGAYDAFLVKFNASGTRQWATYYGGTGTDTGNSMAVDGSGNVYLGGYTNSASGIASGGHQNIFGGSDDAFLVKFNASGTRQWATYYGGTGNDHGHSTAIDGSENVYLTGSTSSITSIASDGHDNTYGGTTDAFLVKFDASGTRQWGTYYGGTSSDYGSSTAVDGSGNVYLAGYTNSTSGIASGGHQNTYGGSHDAFLAKFSTSGVRQWATYYGGTNNEIGLSTAVDGSGNVYLAGETNSSTDIASGGHQNTIGGSYDAFLAKFDGAADCIAPSDLSYSTNIAVYCVGTAITTNSATVSGTAPFTYSVSPALPAGLSLNTTTGFITDTPTATAAAANYTVTATNACGSTTVAVNIAVNGTPTAADAGPDQTVGLNSATMAANTPVVGTGAWSLVSGSGTITSPGSPTTTITNLGAGTNTFRWTISNAPCTASMNDVNLTYSPVTLNCPENTSIAACQTQAAVDHAFNTWLGTASASGGCNGALTVGNGGAPPACGGSTTMTYTYTSTCAPFTTTCQATFTVTAPASPTPVFANCNNTISLGCNPASLPSCEGIASGGFGGAVTASNSCGTVPVSCSASTITTSGCNRTQVFTFTAAACGQPVTCTRTFTWTQVTPPSFNGTCSNSVINLGCNPANLPACDPNVTASNECGTIPVSCTVGEIQTNGCNSQQTLTYTANASGCGTFSTCIKVYNWQVTTAPVFANCGNTFDLGCNPGTIPSCADVQTAPFGGAVTASNECGNIGGISCSEGAVTSNGCNRSKIFTFSVTACGFTSTCTRTFNWKVATAPVFNNCTTGTTNLGCNPANLPSCDPNITATSECGPATVTCTAGLITSNGCNRQQVFNYVATGECGASTCTRTYTWQVDPPATLTCPDNITVAADQTQSAVDAQFSAWLDDATFSGGCNGALSNNNTGAPMACGGAMTVTFTLTTACQTAQTCQATFTVGNGSSTANAGPDQTGMATCGLTQVTLAANTPSAGTGAWSVVSGTGGSFGNTASATSTFSGNAGATYTLRWTVTNPPCATFTDDVTVTFHQNPTPANAGNDASVCGLTAALAGNTPTVGSGAWSLFSGPGTANFVNANSGTTSVTVSVTGAYTFRWTVANAPCTASIDDVTITFTPGPTPADAGNDQTICASSGTATMTGNTPTVGSGAWTKVSGPAGGTITAPGSPTTTVTGMTTPGAYVFKWTISNAPCTASEDQMNVTVNAPPTPSNAGNDASVCGLTAALAGNTPTVGSGSWSLFSGPGTANFVNANSGTTSVTVSVTGAYTFRWTVANAPCTASIDDVTITFTPGPTPADAGNDQTICASSGTATMTGNTPTVGSGAWTKVSGPAGGTITAPGSPTTTVTGMTTPGAYVFKWTISNAPCTASEDQVNVTVNAPPTTAAAGNDASVCGLTTNLAGNAPTVGSGTWTQVSGPGTSNFVNANSGTTSVTVSVTGAYTFRWTVANAPCTASIDDVTITFTPGPTPADAGNDQTICASSGTATMTGNTPTVGSGAWTKVSGPAGGTITAPGSPTTTVTGMTTPGAYVFKWTIANAPCTASEDQMVVTVNAPPTPSNAGNDASVCGLTAALAGNTPTVGSGSWSLFSGPGTANFVNANSGTTSVTVSLTGAYTFRWSVANAPCTASIDDVTITFTPGPTAADAGPDQTSNATCGQTQVTLAANAPTVGAGSWSVQSGTGGSFGNASSPTSTFSGNAGATYTLRWTVTNAPCAASTDEMTVSFNQAPSFSACPPGVTVSTSSGCSTTATYAAAAATTTPAASVTYVFGGATIGSGTGTGSGQSFHLGTTTVNLTATNTCGSSNCSFIVVVQAGEINVQGNGTNILDGDATPSAADHTDFGQTNGPNIVRTFTVQNTSSSVALPVSSITLGGANPGQFSVGPLTPPSPIAANGSATFTVTYAPNATAIHNATVNITSGDCDEGAYDFAIRGELTCSAPTFTACPTNLPSVNASAGTCSAAVTYSVAANGLPTPNLTYTFSGATTGSGSGTGSGSAFNAGVTTVTATATNPCGVPTCSFTVTVVDNQNPSIVCPSSITRNTDLNLCTAVVSYANPTVSDNCSGVTLARTGGPASGSPFPKGATMVNWRATDAAGNSSVCNFTVTVADGQAPSITCPASIVKSTDAGLCSAVATYVTPTYSDNCTGAGLDHISGGLSGSTFSKGVTSVIWQATDGAGLTQRCSFTVTVNDAQAPAITCPGHMTRNTNPGQCVATVTYASPTASDNCTASPTVTIHSGLPSGSAFPKGVNTVVWKATDEAGLMKTCTIRVTVNDLELPTIVCPANQTVYTSGGSCASAAVSYSVTASDNCSTPAPALVRVAGPASGSAFPKGMTNVVWRATDASSNMRTCSFTVTVTDNVAPLITCPAAINVSGTVVNGVCSAVVMYANATATDNCAVASVVLQNGGASGSNFPLGETVNTFRAMDDSGLTATCSFTVTVSCGTSSEGSEKGKVKSEKLIVKGETLAARTTDDGPLMAMNLSPNPATTEVQISIAGLGKSGGEMTMLDAQGRLVWQQRFGPESLSGEQQMTVTLDVSGEKFAAGLYFVTLRSEGQTVTKRLVVQRM